MKSIFKSGLSNALLTALYVVLIALFIFHIDVIFEGDNETVLAPITMLMLLVFSVAVVGSLIFGKPIIWFLEGKKRESLLLLVCTLVILLLLILIAFFGIIFIV